MLTYDSDMPKIEEFVQLKDKEMLEIGCGSGRVSALLAEKVKSLTSIDPDEAQIILAKKCVDGVTFCVGSGEDLDFRDESFDIVMFSYSLHHQDYVKAFEEAKRVLRKDGDLLIIEPTDDGEYTKYVSIFEEDEIQRINRTMKYIKAKNCNILRKDTYYVKYSFINEEELYHHFLDCFGGERDDSYYMDNMDALLKETKPTTPIIISDKVNIFLLKPV